MFYVDGKFLDVNSDTPAAKEYKRLADKLRNEFNWPIVIKTKKPRPMNVSGLYEPQKTVLVPCASRVETDKGVNEWRYTTGHPVNSKHGLTYPISHIDITYDIVIDRKDVNAIDKAMYLIFFCECGVKSGRFVLVDKKAEAKKYVESRAMLSAVSYMLYDDESPLMDEDVRMIAMSLGISKADDKSFSIEEVKVALENKIIEGEKTGDKFCNYKTFKEHAKLGDQVRLLANIQKMYDKGFLSFDDVTCTFYYHFDEEMKEKEKVWQISPVDEYQKDKVFLRYLQNNPIWRETLEKRLGVDTTDIFKTVTKEDLDGMSYEEKKLLGKRLGVKAFGLSNEKLNEAILEKVGK